MAFGILPAPTDSATQYRYFCNPSPPHNSMDWIWLVIGGVSVGALVHSYVVFPLVLRVWAGLKKARCACYSPTDPDLPEVSIIIAAYNEEAVIARKIESTFATDYPKDKIEVLVGSDGSTDRTDTIVKELQKRYPSLRFFRYEGRIGKPQVLNRLVSEARHRILIFTDANVLYAPDTIYHLVKHYRTPRVGVVSSRVIPYNMRSDGIGPQEAAYTSFETLLKYWEGVTCGAMIGAFGASYAMHRRFWVPIPPDAGPDDLFTVLHTLRKGGKALLEPASRVREDVGNDPAMEFRRKVRISTQNFMALFNHFLDMLWPWRGCVAFFFWSHKVLRWFGPFFLMLAWVAHLVVMGRSAWAEFVWWGETVSMALALLDGGLQRVGIHVGPLRLLRHFYTANVALLVGFFKFIRHEHAQHWEPVRRFQ